MCVCVTVCACPQPGTLPLIKYADLKDLAYLGSGAFGDVSSGTYHGGTVAVKKSGLFARDTASITREKRLLGSITPHANVARVMGVCEDADDGALRIVTELCPLGDLKRYLSLCDGECRRPHPGRVCNVCAEAWEDHIRASHGCTRRGHVGSRGQFCVTRVRVCRFVCVHALLFFCVCVCAFVLCCVCVCMRAYIVGVFVCMCVDDVCVHVCPLPPLPQPLKLSFVLVVLHQVGSGLHHVHSCGICHRDIREENVLVASSSPLRLALTDFGLGHILREGVDKPSATYETKGPVGACGIPLLCCPLWMTVALPTLGPQLGVPPKLSPPRAESRW